MPYQLETIALDLETMNRTKIGEQLPRQLARDIENDATGKTTSMGMRIGTAIITS